MNMTSRDLQYFFCIGWQKTGTTLLARVLDQHPNIACIWESYLLQLNSPPCIANPSSSNWKKHGFAEKDVRKWYEFLSRRPGIKDKCLNYFKGKNYYKMSQFREIASSAFSDFANRCQVSVVGDKWPWYIDHIDLVLEAFTDAKFIYNIRDPRSHWNSAQRFKNRRNGDKILREMLKKDQKITAYLDRPNFITIRYEDLVNNPNDTCQKLYEFLGVDFSPDYLIYDPKNDPYPERWDWIPETKDNFDTFHTIKWKEQMTTKEIAKVNEMAHWFIEKYGYEL